MRSGRGPARVLELVGPAGAGKSTLAKALTAQAPAIRASIWGLPRVRQIVSGVLLAPTCVPACRHSRSLALREWHQMARLRCLEEALGAIAAADRRLVVLDEGPVFALAWLFSFGQKVLRCPSAEQWWGGALHAWAKALDVIVILDAPNATLARRIRMRDEPHQIKDGTDLEIREFVARWRSAFEHVISELASRPQGPRVLRLSTGGEPADRIAAGLLRALEGGRDGS